MKRLMGLTVILVALVAGGAIACGGDDDGESGGSNEGGEQDVQQVVVAMTDEVRFEPAQLQVAAGRPVRLTIENAAGGVHDFTIEAIPVSDSRTEGGTSSGGHGMDADEYDLHLALEAGGYGVLEFTPTTPGEYAFVCTVVGHSDAGMTGSLVVV